MPPSATATPPALPQRSVDAALALAVEAAGALAPAGAQVQASAGALDARLRLAACAEITPFLPSGARPWGRTRIGLRCTAGAAWSVTLPVTVQVLAPAVVLTAALPAGARIDPAQLGSAVVDWADGAAPPLAVAEALTGRVLVRPLAAGQPLRPADLQPRVWFVLGDTVRISARGAGFAVQAEGQALTPGYEGQPARVRTESGRIVVGRPVGERQLEALL